MVMEKKKDGRGGPRPNSGRKTLKDRKTAGSVKEATERIDRMQPKCAKAIEEALDATTWKEVAGEWIEVPDHYTRIGAAKIGLGKRIPDVARTEVTGKDGERLNVGIVILPQRQND